MPRLNVLVGSRRGTVVELEGESATIGRSEDCDLILLDETISRHHARIQGRSDGYYLEDLGSRNGTFLNGNAVGQPTKLAHNDCIQLFDVALAFDESEAVASSPADPSSQVIVRRRNRLAETVAQVDIPTFSSDWASVNAESKLQAVLELSRGLEDAIEIDDVQARLLDALNGILVSIDRACLFRVDEHTGRIQLAALRGRDDVSDLSTTIAPLTWEVVEEALAKHRGILVSGGEATRSAESASALSAMCAPLMDMSCSPLGALYVETSDPEQHFTHEDLDVLACVALLASRAVEQATLHSARYRAVVDHASDSIITLSDEGRIESANPTVRPQLGFEPADLIGECVTRILPGFDKCQLQPASWSRDPDARPPQSHREIAALRQDGSTFPASVSLGQFELRGRHYFTATLRDITRQKEEEEQLQRVNEQLEERIERRTRLIRLQQDVAVISNEAESVPDAFSRVMSKVGGFLDWSTSDACLCDADDPDHFVPVTLTQMRQDAGRSDPQARLTTAPSLRAQVVLSGQPCWAPIASNREGSSENGGPSERRLGLAFPVLLGRRVVGVLEFVSSASTPPESSQLKVLSHVGTQLGRIVERHFLQQQLVHAVWRQQRQFGQELHDTLGQELTGIGMFARALQQRLTSAEHTAAQDQGELVAMIQQAKQTARELAKGLQPVEIDAFGLPAALEELARSMQKRTGIDCRFEGGTTAPIDDDEVAAYLYRIAQEAVTNAAKHAGARHIRISLASDAENLCRMEVRDDGVGIRDDDGDGSGGMGMRIMKYRAQSIGADLDVTNTDPGTSVACEFLLRKT